MGKPWNTIKHKLRREQPQGEATPRPEDVATSPSEQCTFHYPLPIQFKDHLEVLQCILKRGHSAQHRAATGETWRGSWEGQAQTEGGEKPTCNCEEGGEHWCEPSSPPATAPDHWPEAQKFAEDLRNYKFEPSLEVDKDQQKGSTPATAAPSEKKWTDDDLYDAYLRGCEDDAIPEPLDKQTFLASWEDVQDVQ